MQYAIETTTGKSVHADNGLRYRTYRCPVCGGEVFLRSGQRYAHHFAHRHETARPECALYTPGEILLDPHRMPALPLKDDDPIPQNRPRISPPDICIEVENRQSTRSGRLPQWKLCITIPKSVDGRGRITYDFGLAMSRTIELSKLFRGSLTYPADPNASNFKAVWCSLETNPAYRAVITERCPGLNKYGITPFASVQGRYKPRVRRLMWGHVYYFVWPKTFDPKFPSVLEALAFESNKDWSCMLVALPESYDKSLVDWLEKMCLIGIENSPTAWSLLYPFLSTYTHDGRIATPAVGQFILGYGKTGETNETKAHAIVGSERTETLLPNQSRSVVALTYSGRVPDVFELVGNYPVSFSFSLPESQSLTEQPSVWGEFESPTKGLSRVPLHTVAARKWLGEVRAGRAQLNGIDLPEIVNGELAWRGSPLTPWTHSPLNRRDGEGRKWLRQVKLEREEVERIQTVLRSTSDEVRVSFRGFGEHHFLAAKEKGDQATRLSRGLRNRMLWLQREISLVHGDGRPVAENISDHDLIQCFLASTPPPPLVGHYQSIRQSVGDSISTRVRQRGD